jgi:hypothetical protein
MQACRNRRHPDTMNPMKAKLTCLSLAAFAFASCDKSGEKANSGNIPSKKPQQEHRANAPTIAEKTAPARPHTPRANTSRAIDPPVSHPVEASMIRPTGTAPDDAAWESLTAEQKLEQFRSRGITRVPKYVSEQILADASSAGTPEDQVRFITEQSAAWHHINKFRESDSAIPEHMKMMLLERISGKHGNSWKDMIPELDEQVAAGAKVDELRANGIPGMTPDESQDFLIHALEKYGPDYKTILSIVQQDAGK